MEGIFERDFYPTPKEVIDMMMADSKVEGKIILEPSAGSGNIVEWLQSYGAKEVIACETNSKLRGILGTKCNLIGDDFLLLTPDLISHVDMIVMNPPFSADAKHILHAYEIAPGGCEIIALCNFETVANSHYSTRTKLKELIEDRGYYRDLGECFASAERKTNVQVACVRLFKPRTGDEEFDGYFCEEEDMEEYGGTEGLMPYNVIRDVVNRYVDAVTRFDAVMSASNEINELTRFIGGSSIRFGAYQTNRNDYCTTITRDFFKKRLQRESWMFLFDKINMRKYVTSGVMEKINRFIELQTNIPFTMKNIYLMIDVIVQTNGQRMNQVLIDAFDKICSFSAENSTAGEKWKTNANYMVNRKFIMPYVCRYDTRWPGTSVELNYGFSGRGGGIDDIVKALCHLTGVNYDDTTDLYSFVNRMKMNWGQWYEWGFFRIRGYKKGTMHFEFVDEKVWMKFNIEVARSKGWELPTKRK
ncbi:DUF4942 domain-containing protein [Bacteroides sp.]|uniref:DUF4942 domain-containing protein n=1 Tax=Bacteroides sp. TaxID=29523 RepID=UPI002621AC0C|nr:DUF4942 domain-containing protein [Bacteroides sp.]MDD3040907.1 DUF4942 domain-containing protein [Bacteroides sp.]